MTLSLHDLMARSGVAFGTSGARGLATAMTDQVCYAYTKGFLQYLESVGELKHAGERVAIGGDFRPSTDRIMKIVGETVVDMGYHLVNCGKVPSPALALYGFENNIPSIMVTGSHIPDDRNGIKFNRCAGEVLKEDEKGMSNQMVEIEDFLFAADGSLQPAKGPPRKISPQPAKTT